MDINATKEGNILISKPLGRLDGTNSRDFEENLKSQLNDDVNNLIIDLEDLVYISSAGLRAILLLAKALNSKGQKLVLCSLSEQIMEVFEISGFNKVISIHSDRSSAISSMS